MASARPETCFLKSRPAPDSLILGCCSRYLEMKKAQGLPLRPFGLQFPCRACGSSHQENGRGLTRDPKNTNPNHHGYQISTQKAATHHCCHFPRCQREDRGRYWGYNNRRDSRGGCRGCWCGTLYHCPRLNMSPLYCSQGS